MDLRRQMFPSPAVTRANQPNAVTACQSSACASSCFGQPVNTSVQANTSIRSIRPNFVKSRAQVFEKKDTDVTKELQPANTVIECDKTSASPLPVKIVKDTHPAVQPRKTSGYVEPTVVSPVPAVRLRDKTTKFTFDVERSPERQNVHHDLRPVSSVGASRHLPSEMPSDAVTQRLQIFQNRPVMSNKPPVSEKPKSPCSDFGANRASVSRSRSSDSVKQSDVNCQGKASSFFSPPADGTAVHDDTVFQSSQGAAPKKPNRDISYLHVTDVGARPRSSARQVKENVVVRPPSPRQVDATVVVNPQPSPSFTETTKVILPKLPQKPQVKEVVAVSPSVSPRQVNETTGFNLQPSSSCPEDSKVFLPKPSQKPPVKDFVVGSPSASSRPINLAPETSKSVLPKAPEKPPRMAVVSHSHDPVTPAGDDSYGLLVYAAGAAIAADAAAPSVRVEKLSPALADPALQKTSGKHVADVRSRLETHGEGNSACSVPEAVVNTSQLQNVNAVRTNAASLSSSVSDAWEKKFIRAPKNMPVVCSRGKKENFIAKRRMNNPSYMYVSMHTDDIIPSQQKIVADKKPLTRHLSDDMLNIPPAPSLPSPKSPSHKQPLYAVPFDFNAAYSADQITFDSDGYAMPYAHNTPQFKVICNHFIAVTLTL